MVLRSFAVLKRSLWFLLVPHGSIANEAVVHRNVTLHCEASVFELYANYRGFLNVLAPKAGPLFYQIWLCHAAGRLAAVESVTCGTSGAIRQ